MLLFTVNVDNEEVKIIKGCALAYLTHAQKPKLKYYHLSPQVAK